MKILAIITSYYPNIKELTKNILQFIDNFDTLIIWQNTPSIDNERFLYSLDVIPLREEELNYFK